MASKRRPTPLPGTCSATGPGWGTVLAGVGVVVPLQLGTAWWLLHVIGELTADSPFPLLARPGDVLVLACAVAGLAIVARWLLGIALGVIAATPGAVGTAARRCQRVLAPRLVIRLTTAVLGGTAVVVAPGLSAAAAPPRGGTTSTRWAAAHTDGPRDPVLRPPDLPDPAWGVPSAPPRRPSADRTDSGGSPRIDGGHPTDAVRVAAGDTLWDLAAHRLPSGASAGAIDRSWRAWYAANRDVVGADPDLIRPGQRLQPPPERGQR